MSARVLRWWHERSSNERHWLQLPEAGEFAEGYSMRVRGLRQWPCGVLGVRDDEGMASGWRFVTGEIVPLRSTTEPKLFSSKGRSTGGGRVDAKGIRGILAERV